MPDVPHETDVLIVGGGTAGCTLAARLSEDESRKVVLAEAGPDITEENMPAAIRSAYPGRAFFSREYFHPELYGFFGDAVDGSARTRARYEQARVLGGGSTINALLGNRGAPTDYDEWVSMGAEGWGWQNVLPYFRKLERDLDFDGPYHGKQGPVPVHRLPGDQTSGFVRQAFAVLTKRGYPKIADQNAEWRIGVMPTALTVNEKGERATTATSYLTSAVRARPNLTVLTEAEVTRLLFEGKAVKGAEIVSAERRGIVSAKETVLCCGTIFTPALLMRNGVGPSETLAALGIPIIRDAPAIGRNLHEHPALGISCFVRPGYRHALDDRHHTQAHLRFSSGLPGCPQGDLLMALIARSAWHAVGSQIATFYLWINKPYSQGTVGLKSADPAVPPAIDFRLLSDPRDLERMRAAFRQMIDVARDPGFDSVRREVFLTSFSDRVRKVSGLTRWNALQTAVLAALLDLAGFARGSLIRTLISPDDIDALLADERALDDYLRKTVVGVWHPVGTCRMGRGDDPAAVTDPAGRVYGLGGLRVCDASLMPSAVCANTNLPTIMIAERVADLIKQGR